MKIGSGIVIGKDDAAGASAVRKPPEDRRPPPGGSAGSSRAGAGIARCPESALVDRFSAAEQLHKALSSD
jgi:hypothetical protein